MVLHDPLWSGMVWYGPVWSGLVPYGLVWQLRIISIVIYNIIVFYYQTQVQSDRKTKLVGLGVDFVSPCHN